MSTTVYTIPMQAADLKNPITPSDGFVKKELSDYKIDLLFLCGYGCVYCSSNCGNNMRCRLARVVEYLGIDRNIDFGNTVIVYGKDGFLDKLHCQLDGLPRDFGQGQTIVVSMLTDAFSPETLRSGMTREVLEVLLDRTRLRIRVLTKFAVGLDPNWLDFFTDHRDRFVVGMSTGTLDDRFAQVIERYTSRPTARARAFENLLDRGISCYAMFCPVLPGAHARDQLYALVDAFQPRHPLVERVWAEPYNDRQNARKVLEHLQRNRHPHGVTFERIFGSTSRRTEWSRYAVDTLLDLQEKARGEGWINKLRFLLYEDGISVADAARIRSLDGVLLQSIDKNGKSKNHRFWALQSRQSRRDGGVSTHLRSKSA